MDAKDHLVISVLTDQRRFVVPIYQRQYSWRTPRLEPFWEDVVAKAEEALAGNIKFIHYMGALILAPGGDGFTIGATPKVQVVDGQQRLTTFQLFLAAIREVGTKLEIPEIEAQVRGYLYVPAMPGDKDPDARFRLVPTPLDRPTLHLIIEKGLEGVKNALPDYFYKNGNLREGEAPNALRAFCYFHSKIEKYALYGLIEEGDPEIVAIDEPEGSQALRVNALLRALLHHLKLVVITLSDTDDAQVIFETLNSKAEPLLAMDLVRNNIFQRASAQGESVEELFEEQWRPFDEDGAFWKADSPRAKPKRPRIDHFLSHALTALSGDEISMRELYAEYRAFTRPKGKTRFETVGEELSALTRFRPVYRTLETGGKDTQLARLGARLNLWEVSTVYPFVFRVATSNVEPEEKERIYELIYAYLVRRAVCGLTPKNLNKTFARIVTDSMKDGVSVKTFINAFTGQRGDTVRFPADAEFHSAIRTKPLYEMFQRKDRLAEILWDLELNLRTKFSVNTARPAEMSIEHILPQTWTTHWPLPDGQKAPADKSAVADQTVLAAIRARDSAVHTLGNLTLITIPGNTVASNQTFASKKPWLAQTLLALNLALKDAPQWDEQAIAERGDKLAELAVKIWPGTEAYSELLAIS